MGANLRPDSTAVNSWAVKEVFKKKMINSKFKERHYCKWEFTKTASRTLGDFKYSN
jgi:hypothetical protein